MTPGTSHDTRNDRRFAEFTAGTLVLIGGALDEDAEILDRIVGLAAAQRDPAPDAAPRIAILTTASDPATSVAAASSPTADNDDADGRYYAELFARHGATGVPIPVGVAPAPPFPGARYCRTAADSEDLAEIVRSCDGVFLGGGDQRHYVLSLFRSEDPSRPPFGARVDTPVMRAIRDVLQRGGVVAGTSAGLAVQQSAPMVSGGTSRAAWLYGASEGHVDDDRLRYLPGGGLGFFTEGLLDSHFNEWGRVARAIRLAEHTGVRLAIGVDEHTALVYRRADRTGEVLGAGGVSVLDVTEAEFASGANGPGVIDVRWNHLTAGDRCDFASGQFSRASEVRVAPGTAAVPSPILGIWDEDRGIDLLRLAQRLLASSARVATAETGTPDGEHLTDAPQFRVTLQRDERTTWTPPGGFSELRVSITPIPSAA